MTKKRHVSSAAKGDSASSINTLISSFPPGPYSIIYADPPWSYKDKALAGKRGAECKYPTMQLEDIMALPVQSIAAEHCALFMWGTWPQMREALQVMKAWGFEHKTCGFVWVKLNKNKPTPFMGMGNYSRSNSEYCLLGVRGKPKRINAGVHQIFLDEGYWDGVEDTVLAPIERHSKKPDIIRDKILQLMGDLPRIELFARDVASGWDGWGNEFAGASRFSCPSWCPCCSASLYLEPGSKLCLETMGQYAYRNPENK